MTGREYETGWLLETVEALVRRFVIMTEEQLLAVALWVLLTWAIEAFDCAPYLDVSSPTRECGKTRLFETLEFQMDAAAAVAPPRRSWWQRLRKRRP